MKWSGMTPAEAEALAAGLYEGSRAAEAEESQETYVPGCDVGEPCPDEWQPVGHVAPEPRRTGVPAAWIAEI